MVDFSCILAAVFFTAANVMKIIYFIKERNRPFDWEQYKSLDPEYIEDDWTFRVDIQALFLSSGFINAFAWICLAAPMVQLGWLLSKQGTQNLGLNVSIIMLAVGGALTEWMSNLFWIGMYVASKTMVLHFELWQWLRPDVADNIGADDTSGNGDGLGWRTLEVNHVVSSGFIWFTDAFEWLCLGGIFLFTFVSVRRWRDTDRTSFGSRWNNLSLFMSFLSLAEFTAQILRFEGFRTAGRISLVYAMLNRLILMPAWILSLGVQLPMAALKQNYIDRRDDGLALTEMNSALDPNNYGNNTAGPSSSSSINGGTPTPNNNGTNPFENPDDKNVPNDSTNPFTIDDVDEQAPPSPSLAGPPPDAFAKPQL